MLRLIKTIWPTEPVHVSVARAMSLALRASLGTAEETWYDRHRRAYLETGDEAELVRMNRHVTLEKQHGHSP